MTSFLLVLYLLFVDGPIQVAVADSVPTSISFKGLANVSSYTTTSIADLGDIKDKASQFENLNIESVSIELLDDYSGASIDGTIKVSVADVEVINKSVNLVKGIESDAIVIPAGQSNILSVLGSGELPVTISLSSSSNLGDDDFTMIFNFRIKGQGSL